MLGQLTREITSLAMTEKWLIASDGGGRLMFYDLEKREVVKILIDDVAGDRFALNETHEALMELETDGDIKVYDITKAELLFVMRSGETFRDVGFSADGKQAVGLTDAGALCAELWTDETELLAYAREFTGR